MASTNKTTNYELSQYIGSDKPTYLGDYNSDMQKIDAGMKANDSATVIAKSTADLALENAAAAQTTATEASSTATTANETAESALSKATTNETKLSKLSNFIESGLSAAKSVAANTTETLAMNSLIYSFGSMLELSGGGVKCNQSGYINVSTMITMSNLVSGSRYQIRVNKNSSNVVDYNIRPFASQTSSTIYQGYNIDKIIEVEEGDIITVQVINSGSASCNVANNASATYMNVRYVD